MTEIALSLVSHTNAGKTTLARTLLGRDVGEVRDAAHVTDLAEAHAMIETPAGDRLVLWDTPGFGDSARLARRLSQHGLGWLLAQVWDRWRDRPLWSSQQAVRHVRDRADVVLYLVNAAEDPMDAGYLEPELDILEWMGKPVVALLNQVGPPRPGEDSDAARWRSALARRPFVHDVLELDAFARCWVQELVLLRTVGEALPADRRVAFGSLERAWAARREAQFQAAMDVLADQLARAACDGEPVEDPEAASLRGVLRDAGQTIRQVGRQLRGLPAADADGPRTRAARALAARLEADLRASTDRLIEIHGLAGHAADEVLERVAENVRDAGRVREGRAAVWGGFVSGALSGLGADLATGGLSFGAGLVAGGLAGALGAAGLARGVNVVRGTRQDLLRWDDAFLDGLVDTALLRYLAVAHYGRGRGEWTAGEHPASWREAVAAITEARRDTLRAARADRGDAVRCAEALRAPLAETARALLAHLYPEAVPDDDG